jgi:hypothetical protein
MVLVGLAPFAAFRDEYWTDDDLRALQSFLLVLPEAGAPIRGGAELRKLRGPDHAAGQGARRIDEGCEGWINSILIN